MIYYMILSALITKLSSFHFPKTQVDVWPGTQDAIRKNHHLGVEHWDSERKVRKVCRCVKKLRMYMIYNLYNICLCIYMLFVLYILIEVGVPAKTMYYIKFYEGNPVGLCCSLPFALHCYSF